MRPAASVTAHVASFLGGSIVYGLFLGVATAVLLLLSGVMPTGDTTEAMTSMGGTVMGSLTIVQIAGFAAWATVLAAMLPERETAGTFAFPERSRIAPHLGMRGADVPLLAVALLGSLTVWTFPSWLASQLLELTGGDQSTLLAIGELLREGTHLDRTVMLLAVVLSAPICEEVVFRGYLWEVAERWGGAGLAFALTTVLFAGYHLDPVHVLSLVPTAAFLGYLRWVSGSVWPPMLAHFGNNAASAVIVLVQPDDSPDTLPLWVGVVGAAFTVACCIVARAMIARRAL